MASAIKKIGGTDENVASGDLAAQMEVLRNDVSALTQIITDLGKAKGADAVAAAKAKADALREKATDTADHARLQAMELQDQANDFIQKQPATALGIAAGIGFLVGFMGSRK